ncbi:MAG: PD-(D/E)XK nuclease family protein, partial [Treponema sp.]|nr:PD-(D/E)XK nuclease family protein [Treponema sp.]
MNAVETVLLENMDKSESLFIFPTDVAVSCWADRLLRLRHGGTVAMEKFIAWDTFKRNSVRSKVQGKQSIPSIVRKMFVCGLIRENSELCAGMEAVAKASVKDAADAPAKAGTETGKDRPIFSSLIRAEWADQADSYTGWITDLLPQLGLWFKQVTGFSIGRIGEKAVSLAAEKFSGDERDLYTLALRYSQFLEKYNLFEPAWETPPFDDTGKKCFIFFSESLSDFGEYRELLEASGHVKIIKTFDGELAAGLGNVSGAVQAPGAGEKKPSREVYFYSNSRSEITGAALYIMALNKNRNIPWESISVSIPDADSYASYLLREFDNRNIPYSMRSGMPLASYPAGQFFTALGECSSSDFSFKSVTTLLLNRRLPWKNNEDIEELVDFGIRNNCIVSWTEENEGGAGKKVNVWDDAFAHPLGSINNSARQFFYDLRSRSGAMRKAATFRELRKQYFAFRGRFLDMEKCLPETDLILSRCISALMELVDMENSFPEVHVPDPYAFFTGYLGEVNYLAQKPARGVVIFPYRTAAPAPFECHIVLGSSQANLTSVFTPLAFLSRSRREKLGITDNDASLAFIKLHQYNSVLPAVFFCSEQTFSGYAIPHSALEAAKKPQLRFGDDDQNREKFAADNYRDEEIFYASLHFPGQERAVFPRVIHKNQ